MVMMMMMLLLSLLVLSLLVLLLVMMMPSHDLSHFHLDTSSAIRRPAIP
jgi:type IV secretory pathway component VirB8